VKLARESRVVVVVVVVVIVVVGATWVVRIRIEEGEERRERVRGKEGNRIVLSWILLEG
jgi:hypothetical protein